MKELDNPITLEDLNTIHFVGFMHIMRWVVQKQEVHLVENAQLVHIRKFDLM